MSLVSVITLANSIIGVSILAMPYCFKQCGIILATIMLILSGMLVKVASHLLLKSALLARRRTIENLAFHTHGQTGKLLVELGIIGYLAGTAIAFFVVMGDLGPPMVAKTVGIENTANLRLVVMTGLGLFVALPLSLIRDISSLQYICTTSIIFYLFVVLRVVLQASPHLISSEWLSQVNLWRPAGMLQCFPIFSLALSCQTNIFEVYSTLPDATPAKMNEVVQGAVNLCSAIYITIGFFGYVAFCYVDFSGNILTAFPQSNLIDLIKLGFCISVAVSFPLVLFPCRTSVHSLIFRKTYQGIGSTELVNDYIPPTRFNMITGGMIVSCLIVGILVPDIELVLGLVGSTMGSCVCSVLPALMFLKLTTKDTTERLAARGVLVVGVCTLLLGTYVNLETAANSSPEHVGPDVFVPPMPDVKEPIAPDKLVEKIGDIADVVKNVSKDDASKEEPPEAKRRQEPVVPEEPKNPVVIIDSPIVEVKSSVKDKEVKEVLKENAKDKDNKAPEVHLDRDRKEMDYEVKSDKDDAKDKLLKELELQKKESAQILKEQKQILQELKEHVKQDKQADEIAAIVNMEKKGVDLQQPQQPNEQQLLPEDAQNRQVRHNLPISPMVQQPQPAVDGSAVYKPGQPVVKEHLVNAVNQLAYQSGQLPIEKQPAANPLPIANKQQSGVNSDPEAQQPVVPDVSQHQQQVLIQPIQGVVQPALQQQGVVQPAQQQQVLAQPAQQQQVLAQPAQQQQVLVQPAQQQQGVVQPAQQQQNVIQPAQQQQNVIQPVQQQQNVIQPVQQQQNVIPPAQQQQNVIQPAQQQQDVAVQPAQQPQGVFQPVQQQQGVFQPAQQQQGVVQPAQQQQGVVQPAQQQQGVVQPAQRPLGVVQPDQRPLGAVVQTDQQQQYFVQPAQQQLKVVQSPQQQDVQPNVPQIQQEIPRPDPQELLKAQKSLEKPNQDVGIAGRDLKEHRQKRDAELTVDYSLRCLNDPLCEDKFSRDPMSDSLVDRDFAKFLKVGQRSLLNIYSDENLGDANITDLKKIRSL